MSHNLYPPTKLRDDATVARDVLVRLLVTEAERQAWQRAADAAGLKLSEYIRRRVTGETVVAAPPAPGLKPKKGRRRS